MKNLNTKLLFGILVIGLFILSSCSQSIAKPTASDGTLKYCSDGTKIGYCSMKELGKRCKMQFNSPTLIDDEKCKPSDCNKSGCPSGSICNNNICQKSDLKCSDETLVNACSRSQANIGKYCDEGIKLIDNCLKCGCKGIGNLNCNEKTNKCE